MYQVPLLKKYEGIITNIESFIEKIIFDINKNKSREQVIDITIIRLYTFYNNLFIINNNIIFYYFIIIIITIIITLKNLVSNIENLKVRI